LTATPAYAPLRMNFSRVNISFYTTRVSCDDVSDPFGEYCLEIRLAVEGVILCSIFLHFDRYSILTLKSCQGQSKIYSMVSYCLTTLPRSGCYLDPRGWIWMLT